VPAIDDEALVLDSHPYGDRHLVLALLTRRCGAQRGVLRRARGGKTPAAAAAQVLSRVRLSLSQRPQAELADIRSLELITSSYPLAVDLERPAAAAVVAELLAAFCPLGQPAERSFRLGVAALEALLAGIAPELVVAYTAHWVLALDGVLPGPDAVSAAAGAGAASFLAACRERPLSAVAGPVPTAAAAWLDRRLREEAERPLHALAHFRGLGS
jgi:hypothetical protein